MAFGAVWRSLAQAIYAELCQIYDGIWLRRRDFDCAIRLARPSRKRSLLGGAPADLGQSHSNLRKTWCNESGRTPVFSGQNRLPKSATVTARPSPQGRGARLPASPFARNVGTQGGRAKLPTSGGTGRPALRVSPVWDYDPAVTWHCGIHRFPTPRTAASHRSRRTNHKAGRGFDGRRRPYWHGALRSLFPRSS